MLTTVELINWEYLVTECQWEKEVYPMTILWLTKLIRDITLHWDDKYTETSNLYVVSWWWRKQEDVLYDYWLEQCDKNFNIDEIPNKPYLLHKLKLCKNSQQKTQVKGKNEKLEAKEMLILESQDMIW